MNDVGRSPRLSPPTRNVILVGVGGAAGTMVRVLIAALVSPLGSWPWGPLIANVIGCFGLAFVLSRPRDNGSTPSSSTASDSTPSSDTASDSAATRPALGWTVGFFGGLTTFSSVVVVGVTDLPSDGVGAVGWLTISVATGLAAFLVGTYAGRRSGARLRPTISDNALLILLAATALTGLAVLPLTGAVIRWRASVRWNPPPGVIGFPWGTFGVNVAASFVLGLITPSGGILLLLTGAGFCGALSTFSTFIAETVAMAKARRWLLATLYVAASLAAGTAMAWIGVQAGG